MVTAEERGRVGFTSELGLTVRAGGDTLTGIAPAVPELCIPEAGDEGSARSPEETARAPSINGGAVLRPSVLLTWADILSGSLANEHTLPQICMTVDLTVRVAAPIPVGAEVRAVGRLLKVGRTITFAETIFTVEDDPATAAIALSTFVASPRPQDVAVSFVRGDDRVPGRAPTAPPEPVTQMLGTRVLASGIVEVPRHPRVLNWADTVQGGAVAACAEEAVLALDAAPVPTELEVRFTGAVRRGPMRATARMVGPWVRIDVVDAGSDDRLVAVAAAREA